eukprot:364619-Chlamydomonas_euryale.AAC.2
MDGWTVSLRGRRAAGSRRLAIVKKAEGGRGCLLLESREPECCQLVCLSSQRGPWLFTGP